MTALIARASQFCIALILVGCMLGFFVAQRSRCLLSNNTWWRMKFDHCRCAMLRSALMADQYCTRRMYRRSGR
jgi:hypothetical protein